jgi:hypothetical protein
LFLDDCISLDDHTHEITSRVNNVSTQTTTTFLPSDNIITKICCNRHDTSSEDICQEKRPFSSQTSRIPRRNQYFGPTKIRSPSFCPYRTLNDEQPEAIASGRSQSVECISLPKLGLTLTNDSGTDDLEPVPTPTPAKCAPYEIVPVFGLPQRTIALMTNRYDFDPTKVEEFRVKKHKLQLPFNKKKSPNPARRNTTDNSITKKPTGFASLWTRRVTPSSTQQNRSEPMVRHHSSQDGTDA